MRFLLFDADYTLLDFPEDMVRSFKIMYGSCFAAQRPYSEELLRHYEACNNRAWDRFERGECTKQELYISRFIEFLSKTGLSGDPEAINEKYFTAMAETGTAYPGAVELVKELSLTYDLYIITNGNVVSAIPRIRNSGLAPYFKEVFVSEAVGVGKPDKRYFDHVAASIPNFSRSEAVVIGDSPSSDLQGAVNAGLRSIWYDPPGAWTNERKAPQYTWRAESYDELREILRNV
ncbi:YjjG family noncanonical pyrimidine nucleotidase [Acutalibacter muris]|uniref:YjjG family noncanonical pyrimidine nucleotidase n=1 Tax=Acutalibacter muris TaxID=1796620 RepID=UPI00272E207D|nr:YjjG family noncanonical pyrimidine nucleotidase [Acutalibacter muris]